MFTIRPATRDDANDIRWLVLTTGINPIGLDWRRFLVAVDPSSRVIGCGQIKSHRNNSQELASIAVTSEWRGKGVARAIIERLLADRSNEIYLMCRSGLVSLYEKFGFQIIAEGDMPKYYRRVSRLAGLINMLQSEGEKLTVMRRPGC